MTDEKRAVERWENEGGKRLAWEAVGEERNDSQFGKVVTAFEFGRTRQLIAMGTKMLMRHSRSKAIENSMSWRLEIPADLKACLDEVDSMRHDQHNWISMLVEAPTAHVVKRCVVAVIGGSVTLIGIALIVLPGPAFIVIPIGLAILATEFVWAKRWLQKARRMATQLTSKPTTDT
jgi:uncharacterized protein (TIGR02611 family)